MVSSYWSVSRAGAKEGAGAKESTPSPYCSRPPLTKVALTCGSALRFPDAAQAVATWGHGVATGRSRRDAGDRGTSGRRPTLGHHRLGRSGEPDVVRDLGVSEA